MHAFIFLGEQVQRVYRIFLHVIYILVAMIVAAFLQMPCLTRASIMGIVPMNLITYLKLGTEASLDFTSMTVLIFLITASELCEYISYTLQYKRLLKKCKKKITATRSIRILYVILISIFFYHSAFCYAGHTTHIWTKFKCENRDK